MKKFALILILQGFASVALAATPLNYDLAKRAVALSAVVDAYGAYCQKPSTLGTDYIARFKENKLEEARLTELEVIRQKAYDTTSATLTSENKDCKDVQLLLKRLEIMRSLKDVSYELNGIDPATVKDNIPSLEALMPDSASTRPSDVPLELEEKTP